MKIQLTAPIKRPSSALVGETITLDEIEVRRPTAFDLLGIVFDGTINHSMFVLVSRISGLSIKEVQSLDFKDFNKIFDWLSNLK